MDITVAQNISEYEIFVLEDEMSAVIDTACTKTVAGEPWFKNFYERLDDSLLDENEIEIYSSVTPFKLGDGKKFCHFEILYPQ